jgi:hypothetical protein
VVAVEERMEEVAMLAVQPIVQQMVMLEQRAWRVEPQRRKKNWLLPQQTKL